MSHRLVILFALFAAPSSLEARVSPWHLEPADVSTSMRLGALESADRFTVPGQYVDSNEIELPTTNVPSPGVVVPFALAGARVMRRPVRESV